MSDADESWEKLEAESQAVKRAIKRLNEGPIPGDMIVGVRGIESVVYLSQKPADTATEPETRKIWRPFRGFSVSW